MLKNVLGFSFQDSARRTAESKSTFSGLKPCAYCDNISRILIPREQLYYEFISMYSYDSISNFRYLSLMKSESTDVIRQHSMRVHLAHRALSLCLQVTSNTTEMTKLICTFSKLSIICLKLCYKNTKTYFSLTKEAYMTMSLLYKLNF